MYLQKEVVLYILICHILVQIYNIYENCFRGDVNQPHMSASRKNGTNYPFLSLPNAKSRVYIIMQMLFSEFTENS